VLDVDDPGRIMANPITPETKAAAQTTKRTADAFVLPCHLRWIGKGILYRLRDVPAGGDGRVAVSNALGLGSGLSTNPITGPSGT
jgi:hypothetical protein